MPAFAELGKNDETSKQRDATPANTGSNSGSTPVGGLTPETVDRTTNDSGLIAPTILTRFHAEIGWEMHAFLVSNNLVGNGAETLFNYFYGNVRFDLTKNDKLSLTAGFYRYALTDPSETDGFRSDDIVLSYNHHENLPWKVNFDITGSILAPTSFESHKEGLVTAPRLKIGVDRTFFKYLSINPRVFGEYYWQTYNTIQGGSSPNPIGRLGMALTVAAELPVYTPISAGVNLYTGYVWYYNPNAAPPSGDPFYGTENNPTYKSNPAQQSYGWEVYVRYDPKPIFGLSPGIQVAYAQGDPTAGYTGVLIDGVSQFFLFYPEQSQVYTSLTLRY